MCQRLEPRDILIAAALDVDAAAAAAAAVRRQIQTEIQNGTDVETVLFNPLPALWYG